MAMPGLVLVAAAAFVWLFDRQRQVAAVLGVALLLILPSLTFARNQVWGSAMSLWTDALSKSPNKARVHVNVGVANHAEGNLDEAIHHYCRALEIAPGINIARDNIEIALDEQGKLDAIINDLLQTAKPVSAGPEGGVMFEYDVSEHACPHLKERGS
jgi:tetratricopeptide (TPR) repeat protein